MTTVIAGADEQSFTATNDVLTTHGIREFNRLLKEKMETRFPGTSFHVVAGGQASGKWNALVAGCRYALPTEEHEAARWEISSELALTDDPSWWEEDEEGMCPVSSDQLHDWEELPPEFPDSDPTWRCANCRQVTDAYPFDQ